MVTNTIGERTELTSDWHRGDWEDEGVGGQDEWGLEQSQGSEKLPPKWRRGLVNVNAFRTYICVCCMTFIEVRLLPSLRG